MSSHTPGCCGFRLVNLVVGSLAMVGAIASADEINFQRDVQPILAERCLQCHGADAQARRGGLRLDLRDQALLGGESGEAAIVPGDPAASELVRRVASGDADQMMPPPEEQKALSPEQIATLSQWIRQGAAYDRHWAFTPPSHGAGPPAGAAHPVDAFVTAKLRSLGLQMSSPAASSALCRRLYLDVVGLPPTPEELQAFEVDGYAATLEALLFSQRYGEKWARHWLDVARYSDTNGYEKDLRRDQWIWRDWVIQALNRDLPYNEFLIEQIAGDLFPDRTQDQVVATGFLRNSMINEEGAIIPEQFRMVEMFDRIDCIGKAVLGMTTQCAQCHTHKFDPITMDEYYGMFAFLNNSFEAKSWVYTAQQQTTIQEIHSAIAALENDLREQRRQWQAELEAWAGDLAERQALWEPIVATELGSVSGLSHPTQEGDASLLMLGHASSEIFMLASPDLAGVTGLRLEALCHGDLPFRGPGRSAVGGWGVQELEVSAKRPDNSDWEKLKLVHATADFSEPEQKDADGKRAHGPVAFLIDASHETVWTADRGGGRRNQPSVAVVQFEQPLDLPAGSQLKVVLHMSDMLGCCRISTTQTPNPVAAPVDYAAILALATCPDQRTPDQRAALFTAWRRSLPDAQAINDAIQAWWQKYPQAATSVLHLAERGPNQHRTTYMLDRGAWDRPLLPAAPHTPAALHPLADTGEPDRLRFARWLADPRSPLTARVAVNRVWQAIFGAGLVETSEDFGTRTAIPEYRELLDWLAVDFMEHGWSQKQLIRTILTSAAYQQRSQASPELLEIDPTNRLLTRGPRFRVDAEVVRDIALCVSGLITDQVGGPSVIPPVPKNVLDYNYVYPSYWTPAEGADRYRRTVYGFRKRSMPDPAMSSFDAPNGDISCARRVRSNTPLAALTGLNEPIFVEAARALALRILSEGGSNDAQRIGYAFLLCVARHPTSSERDELLTLLQSRRIRLAEGWLNVREVATGDPAKLPDLPEGTTPQDAAAWTIVARVLLNLDETISKR